MSRLSIEIDPEEHRQIKTLATFAGLSIKDYILAKMLPSRAANRVAELEPTDQLLSSPKNAARLKQAIAAPASEHRIFESLKDLEDALGI